MRALGIMVLAVWMAWIGVRVELTFRAADDMCKEVFVAAEGYVPAGKCAGIVVRDRLLISSSN